MSGKPLGIKIRFSYVKPHIGQVLLIHKNIENADQPAHLRSLISIIVIHFLESIIAEFVRYKI